MELHNLKPAQGATKKRKRIARGQGSGHGGTATKGHKGAKSRSGDKLKRNFEGGQMPLQMRLPKVGFKSLNKIHYVPLNLEQIQAIHEKFGADTLTIEFLKEKGYLSRTDKVKILARGELSAKVSVSVHKISATAREAIEKAGGTVHLV
ncbi:MAG: 50S ribosomal protein L15 [Saprospiraceae bacterium]|jgi:large subunit ribosomal protein L15